MKKNSTGWKAAKEGKTKQKRQPGKQEAVTIGLDLGDKTSCYCALDERGEVLWERAAGYHQTRDDASVWEPGTLPSGAGSRNAFFLGEPITQAAGA